MLVWVLNIEDCFQGEQHYSVELFDSEEKAKNRLKVLRDDFFANNNMEDYNIDMDNDDELDVYLQGFYNFDRFCLYITEQNLM